MASLNKVMLIGGLGKDVEIRYTASGTAVASFSMATSEKFKDKAGEWQEKTEWHNIVLWGKLAELAGEYLAKGKSVYIEGRLQTRKWQDKSGNDRYTTDIVGDKMQFLSPKKTSNDSSEGRRDSSPGQSEYHQESPPFDDDIPF